MVPRKNLDSADRHRIREDALRPCPTLGYDRNSLGLHLMSCEAFGLAETQFRRAVWLNPYEPRFVLHLAFCLHKQCRSQEALELIRQRLGDVNEKDVRESVESFRRVIERKILVES